MAIALAGLCLLAGGPFDLSAQSIVRGELEGLVMEAGGSVLPEVSVTLTDEEGRSTLFLETDRSGRFDAGLLGPGAYRLLVEAPGFVPRLVTGVQIRSGQVVRLDVDLTPAPPPVVAVDTVPSAQTRGTRFGAVGNRSVSRAEIDRFADPRLDLTAFGRLHSSMDGAFGFEGLPGASTSLVLDGLPYRVARHPSQRGMPDLPILPWLGLASLDIHHGTDVEWAGAAGGYVAASSRSSMARPAGELRGSGSTSALRQSEALDGLEAPDATSAWGGGVLHLPLNDTGSSFFAAAEGAYDRAPRRSPLSADLAGELASVDPGDAGIDENDLSSPWLSESRMLSGLTRLDWVGESTEFQGHATFGTTERTGGPYFAEALAYGSAGPVRASDVSIGGSVLSRVRPDVVVEGRLALQRSKREWSGPEGADTPSLLPPTLFIEAGEALGSDPGMVGTVERTTFLATGVVHFDLGAHRLKMGLRGTLSSHTYSHVFGSAGSFFFSDPGTAEAGHGYLTDVFVGGDPAGRIVPERTFSVPQFGGFVQHLWEPTPGLSLTSGLRFDYETLPRDEVPRESGWAFRTGFPNNQFEEGLAKIGPRVALQWDPAGTGATRVEVEAAAHYDDFDPGVLNEAIATPERATGRRQIGGLAAWPSLPTSEGDERRLGRRLTILGPDLEAPRTVRASAGLAQRLGDGATLSVSGTFRRTESLLRRTDLNRPIVSTGLTAQGRPLYGTLTKRGSMVVPEPGSNRRFHEFEHVWGLDSSGWSDYVGLTLALEYAASDALELFGGYTFSSTEDNLVGARSAVPVAEVGPRLGADGATDWDEAVSDFDLPHRLAAGFLSRFPVLAGLEVSGIYHFRSGTPFTAGYRVGVDVNGDGSVYNDPALIPNSPGDLSADAASCVGGDAGGIAKRNGCRSDGVHSLDLHLSLGLFRIGDSRAALTLDAFNVMDAEVGLPDSALLLVDESAPLVTDSGAVEIPVSVNPAFGEVTQSVRPGRLIRIGFSVGMP